jgi:hypothetical protein
MFSEYEEIKVAQHSEELKIVFVVVKGKIV